MRKPCYWEVVLNDEASMFPEGATTHTDAVACVQFILDQLQDGRYIVGVKPCREGELEAN